MPSRTPEEWKKFAMEERPCLPVDYAFCPTGLATFANAVRREALAEGYLSAALEATGPLANDPEWVALCERKAREYAEENA